MSNHSTTRRNLLAGAACVAVLPVPAIAATSTADVNAGAFCTKTGACPCADPCIWGKQAIDDLRRDGWPNPDATTPDSGRT